VPLFRINPEHPFQGPHQNQPTATAGPSPEQAGIAMILVHGRGASAESMLLFAEEFERDDVHYRALQASGHTWYPQSFLAPKEQNQPGINSGLQGIYDQIQSLSEAGITTDKIILLGFSQGCLSGY
jgi:phospholipase/carboxylesterase